MWHDIRNSHDWIDIKPLNAGWSGDKKYIVRTKTGKLLLRINSIENFDKKQREYDKIKLIEKSGINMSRPLDFGICNNGKNVYMLLTWIEGEDLESILPKVSKKEQYTLGQSAGIILKAIHSLPVGDFSPSDIAAKKLRQLDDYEKSSIRIPDDEPIIEFIKENVHILNSGRMAVCHGDFHPGNLIYTPEKKIGVIDFNRSRYAGDPYEEFYKLQHFGQSISKVYASAQITSYFDGNIPTDFWKALAVYIAHTALHSIKWAESFGMDEVRQMQTRAYQAIDDYDGFARLIPKWYDCNEQ